jgi:hypothetical protein
MALVLVGLPVLLYGAVLLRATMLALGCWLRARRSERSFTEDAVLAPGELVLHGTVEYAPDEHTAVRVEIDQEGSEAESSGNWTTVWSERERRIEARPFFMRLANGDRVRVEPTREVELVDDMDGTIRVDLTKRTRIAELIPGEEVFVHGRLSAGPGMVMRPSKLGHLLISTEPLGERFRRPMRQERGFALGALLLLVLSNLFVLPYHTSLFAGRVGTAVIRELSVVIDHSDDGTSTCHRVTAELRAPSAENIVQCVDKDEFAELAVGMTVPARITEVPWAGWSSAELGTHATVSVAAQFLPLIALIAASFYLARRKRWGWRHGKLNEAEVGRLDDSTIAGAQGMPAPGATTPKPTGGASPARPRG